MAVRHKQKNKHPEVSHALVYEELQQMEIYSLGRHIGDMLIVLAEIIKIIRKNIMTVELHGPVTCTKMC